nr:flagellar hook protein FlgE [Rhodoferax sp.]
MSFQTGLSGLNASSKNLDVIGNNIANANTTGMKSSRAEFSDIVASSLGASSGNQAGIGVSIAAISQQFTQGNINITGNSLDVAINGGGFFQETMPDGSFAYTRAGDFKLDSSGFIKTNSGGKLMGYPTTNAGVRTSSTLAPLQLPTGAPIAASKTTTIAAQFNLPAGAPIAATAVPPTPRSTYGTSLTAFDSQGTAVPASMYFVKTGANTWDVYDKLDDPLAVPPVVGAVITSLTFNASGQLSPVPPVATTIINLPDPATSPPLPAPPTTFSATIDFTGATQFGTGFSVSNLTQDGYTSGELTKVNIGESGAVTATYSNGKTQTAGQVALMNFRNVQGLRPVGSNNWIETSDSGQPVQGVPGIGKFGALRSGALEESNVDLTAELVNMMTAQRNYQANAQTIKTQDQVMSTLVNLR